MNVFKVLAIIMIFIGSGLFVFGLSYLTGRIFLACNPFLLSWIIESVILTLLLFWGIYFDIF